MFSVYIVQPSDVEMFSVSESFASFPSADGDEIFPMNSEGWPGSTAEVFGVNLLGESETIVSSTTVLFGDFEPFCPFAPVFDNNKSAKVVEESPMFAIDGVDLFGDPMVGISPEAVNVEGKYLHS